jgi:hypothetical protein
MSADTNSRFSALIEDMKAAIERDPVSYNHFNRNLGMIHAYEMEDFEQARGFFNSYLKTEPDGVHSAEIKLMLSKLDRIN